MSGWTAWALALCAAQTLAAELPQQLAECGRLADAKLRLACYDGLAAGQPAATAAISPPSAIPPAESRVPVADVRTDAAPAPSRLAEAWDLDGRSRGDTFGFRLYRPNYYLPVWQMAKPNNEPQSPTRPPSQTPGGELDKTEAKFQLSFKTKVWEDIFDTPLNLWFAYTQQSHWQIYNRAHSAPFRGTDYEPELILTFPLPSSWAWGDTRLRMGGLGLLHQSNGRANPLSRSWNRVYAMAALDNGPFTLQGRWWARLPESGDNDDNPDIVKYLGHGDLQAIYQYRGQTFSALWRPNFDSGKHGLQLDWSFPLRGKLRGYVQAFDGYGENLIDYNVRTRALGVGLTMSDWLE